MEQTQQPSLDSRFSRDEITAAFGPNLEFDKNLAPYTSYGTGGPTAYFLSATSAEEIAEVVKTAKKLAIPFVIIGGGTNILVSDSGFKGLVIKVDVKGMASLGSDVIECGAGEQLEDLVNFAAESGLTGLEFAAGIVGSVGGAIYGNAGAYFVVVDGDGNIATVPASHGKFAYRDSALKTNGEVVVKAEFQLRPGDKAEIKKKVDDIVTTRHAKLPYDCHSAGCFFKNIQDAGGSGGQSDVGRRRGHFRQACEYYRKYRLGDIKGYSRIGR
jgi:UDP-N-acetylmuramate dehydrogenase